MSKKVLVLSGSPRKGGNSDILCDEFMRGASDAGHQVEKVFIRDKKIGFCNSCYGSKEMGVIRGGDVYEAGAVRETKHMAAAYEMGRNV